MVDFWAWGLEFQVFGSGGLGLEGVNPTPKPGLGEFRSSLSCGECPGAVCPPQGQPADAARRHSKRLSLSQQVEEECPENPLDWLLLRREKGFGPERMGYPKQLPAIAMMSGLPILSPLLVTLYYTPTHL